MPVFNAAEFLTQSIESILFQTYSNFEFIIVDDHSTDHSWTIIQKYAKKDKRIKAFRNPINLGVSLTSNIALSKCRGKFIARMDADDISIPTRLQLQLAYFKTNPQTIALGGQCQLIDQNNKLIGQKNFPSNPVKLAKMLFWAIPIQQPSMMINTLLLPKKFLWYQPNRSSAEEVDLLFRLSRLGNLSNLNQTLLFYRILPTSLSHSHPKKTFWLTFQSRLNALQLGSKPSPTAIFLNLLQIIVVTFLPEAMISNLWYSIRNLKKTSSFALESINV